jgi:hypothetical protein
MQTQSYSWERPKQPGVTRGNLDVDFGAGELKLGPAYDRLFRADFSTVSRPETGFEVENGEAQISVKNPPVSGFTPHWSGREDYDWNLFLQNDLPWEINIDSGATNGTFDFSDIMVESLSVDTGASNLVVRLGDNGGETAVSIAAGASSLTLQVPITAALRMKISSALAGQEFEGLDLTREGEYYVTPNLEQAKSIINLDISAAASRLRVESYSAAGVGI